MGKKIHISKEVLDYWGYVPMLSTSDEIREEIYLPKKNIISIEPFAFSSFNHLTTLDLSRNSLTKIDKHAFKGMKSVLENKNLIFFFNSQHTFSFKGLNRLETLDLNNNRIEILSPDSFFGLSALMFLNLTQNFVKKIDHLLFEGLLNLFDLNLSFNKIESIADGSFQDLNRLIQLNIENNYIKEIQTETFIGLVSLQDLQLRSNKIEFASATSIKQCIELQTRLTQKCLDEIFAWNPIKWKNLKLAPNRDIIFED